jgi:nitrite reductase/ring-hydroxylating ferredoxin subunit
MPNTAAEAPEHLLGDIDDFPKRKVVPAQVGGRRIGVLRHGDDIYAFADHCPHHGGPMCYAQVMGTMLPSDPNEFRYDLDGLVIKCPWHAYEFDVRTGRAIGDIIRSRLMVYRTEVRDRKVFVQFKRAQPAFAAEA